jgi:ribosome biogenesis GTPase A
MAKTRRVVKENLKHVDVVIELLDARIPYSSRNPEIDILCAGKKKIVVLNKSDLADEKANAQWKNFFQQNGNDCIFLDTLKGKGLNEVKNSLRNMMKEKIEHVKAKGILQRAIRTMVVGIPNVGKSTFINKIAGKSIALTGDKPGVTRSNQWIRINSEIELLDTPGILWPKFEDESVGINLAVTGAIKDAVIDTAEITIKLLEILRDKYPSTLCDRFKLTSVDHSGHDLLEIIGKKRGCIISGGEIDIYRASGIVLDEFRGGKIGKVTLELPLERIL